jgi:hypothetical protein
MDQTGQPKCAQPRRVTKQQPWAVRVTLLASEAELDLIVSWIGAAICLPPDHLGHCVNPWSITSTAVEDLDEAQRSTWLSSVDELIEQRNAERQQ